MKTDLPIKNKEEYLGDGLYARFDGIQIILRAPRDNKDHFVALEPQVYRNLIKWVNEFSTLKSYLEGTLI